jgi:hypothetical protein
MPLVLVNWIVVDPMRRAKGQSTIGATREHDVTPVAGAKLLHRGEHIDVVVGSCA